MTSRSTPIPKRAVSADLETWLGLAANCMGRELPRLTIQIGTRDRAFRDFIARCTPGNVFALLTVHVHALEAMQALAAHLEALPCICPHQPEPGSLAAQFEAVNGEAHVDVCPRFIRAHDSFQRFDGTALEGPLPRILTIVPRPTETVPAPPEPTPTPAEPAESPNACVPDPDPAGTPSLPLAP